MDQHVSVKCRLGIAGLHVHVLTPELGLPFYYGDSVLFVNRVTEAILRLAVMISDYSEQTRMQTFAPDNKPELTLGLIQATGSLFSLWHVALDNGIDYTTYTSTVQVHIQVSQHLQPACHPFFAVRISPLGCTYCKPQTADSGVQSARSLFFTQYSRLKNCMVTEMYLRITPNILYKNLNLFYSLLIALLLFQF